MFNLVFLFIGCSFCTEHEANDLRVEYLENLINLEVRKARHYKARVDNRDYLGNVSHWEESHDFGEFDFIVVGGGSSGSIVSSRLSENDNWKVLLLEAGDINDDFTDIPYVFDALGLSDRNWGYLTVPQEHGCFGRMNKQCPCIRGRILGGTGSINGLTYSRGIERDFQRWVEAGNVGWSWNDVLPFYKKFENFENKNIDLKYRGFNGPLNVAYAEPRSRYHEVFVQANEEIGLPHIDDYNAERIIGVSRAQINTKNGRRVSGANNYVIPAWNRFNFNVTLKSFVTKILINDTTKVAYGVEFVKENKKYRAIARKEVIVSGGAVNSPQLLMLSGIGPKAHLLKHGIKVIQDLPVGQYMKDHIALYTLFFKSNHTEPSQSTTQLIKQYLEYEGLLTNPTNFKSITYCNVKNKTSPYPDIEITFSPPKPTSSNLPQFANYRDEINGYLNSINQSTHWNLEVFALHPKSSGVLSLQSSDPKDFPLVNSKLFEEEDDLEVMYRGILVALKLTETSAAKAFNLSLNLHIPSCANEIFGSKHFWYCFLRQMALPAYHLSSTTKMGPPHDHLAVVNPELKVYGIKNLRVIDVGIVPSTGTGHTNALAFLIGEKGADLVKRDHLK